MLKKLFRIIVLILMVIGIVYGVSISIHKKIPTKKQREAESNFLNKIQTKSASLTEFYTYGRSFNVRGIIKNVDKDNFENAKLVITDGLDYEDGYNLDVSFEENNLIFYSNKNINTGMILDKLENKEYYICIRLKLNNRIDAKYYSFENASEYGDELNYYTVTKDGKNRLAKISFSKRNINNNEYNILTIKLEDSSLPEDVYDIVIDAGNGGKDPGEISGANREADINLDYAKALKQSLEEKGYKVKLTRDDENTDTYTYNNMYDENGRISIACKTHAKLMISFQVNNGSRDLNGLEVCCPCKSNLNFGIEMASKIKEYTNIAYSNNNLRTKIQDGVYVKNYTDKEIAEARVAAKRKGYEPYNITDNTPYYYTIREVGGIATEAYVDGRNKDYSKNEYYKSNQGIECYQIELGYIKTDIDIIKNEKEGYIRAITEAIVNNY